VSSNVPYYVFAGMVVTAVVFFVLWATKIRTYISPASDDADAKTSWIQLLIVGLGAIGGAGSLIAAFLALSNAQAVEAQRAEASLLQDYLKQAQSMIVEHKDTLKYDAYDPNNSEPQVNEQLRAQTLAVLGAIKTPERKRQVLRYLYDSNLIKYDPYQPTTAVDLWNADLERANLSYYPIRYANLNHAVLQWAKLDHANLYRTYLYGASLAGANFNSAYLEGANLGYTDLTDADFSKADLPGADLQDASGITNEELEQQARSLKGAIMPDGSKHD
jgi:uncharacterized protein YjbI with pentapeptide repeats